MTNVTRLAPSLQHKRPKLPDSQANTLSVSSGHGGASETLGVGRTAVDCKKEEGGENYEEEHGYLIPFFQKNVRKMIEYRVLTLIEHFLLLETSVLQHFLVPTIVDHIFGKPDSDASIQISLIRIAIHSLLLFFEHS